MLSKFKLYFSNLYRFIELRRQRNKQKRSPLVYFYYLLLFSIFSSQAVKADCSACNNSTATDTLTSGQLSNYCAAQQAAGDSKKADQTVMYLDLGAAAICGVACVYKPVEAACSVAAIGAGVMEVIETFKQKSGGVGQLISLAGTAVSGYTAVSGGISAVGGGAAGDGAAAGGGTGTPQSSSTNMSCYTAAMMALMGGMRAASANQDNKAQQQNCDNAQQLASSTATVGSATGGATAGTAGGTSGNSGSVASGLSCISSSGMQACASPGAAPKTAAAMDSQILTNTGLDKAAAPVALQHLPDNSNGGLNAGATMGAMGAGLGKFGEELAKLAQIGQEHGSELVGVPGALMSSGGGGSAAAGGGEKEPDIAGLLASLMGQKEAEKNPENGVIKFGSEADIWHKNSKNSIFQIVSTRLIRSSHKVVALDWASPMNRALAGTGNRATSK